MDISSLFGFATTIATSRASSIGLSSFREKIALAFTMSFGYGEYTAKSIYQQVKAANLTNLDGLQVGSSYDTIEQKVYNIFNLNYPNESEQNKKILSLATNALLFSFYTYQGVNIETIAGFIGTLLNNTCQYVTGNQLFNPDSKGNIYTPFTKEVIKQFLGERYDLTISSLSRGPKTSNIEVVNYNWMEVEDIFAKPNLTLMKDIENQYYYVSGQLSYQSEQNLVPDCISVPVTINTPTGDTTFNYYLQEPCIESNTYIGPVTGVSFYRVFSDGPYSSGDFNAQIKQAYIQFDKNILNKSGYSSNSKILYSFLTGSDSGYLPISLSQVFIDANGQYNLNEEYSHVPESYDCSHVYSGNMHIGNNAPKIICDRDEFDNCINCRFVPMTGYKFASLELNKQFWGRKFANLKTNPVSSIDNYLKRALNILPYSYLSTLNGDSFDTMGPFNQRYLGYPQLTGQNALPSLAFFQDFDSPTFNKFASISLYPAIGTSNNGTDEDSDRTFNISNLNIFSGSTTSHVPIGASGKELIKFTKKINSSGLVGDEIAQKFFGMGNNFNNQFNTITVPSYNAGYEYDGVYIDNSGSYENAIFANLPYQNTILGSPVKNINYIKGYASDVGDEYIVKKIYAQDSGGALIPYYYLLNEDLPNTLQINENGTPTFCPLPDVLEYAAFLGHITGSQQVENYLPRYSSGAFATSTQKFLYPNAQAASTIYNSKSNGFPIRINFTINIREETVRELYARFTISNNGLVFTSPKYVNVIRPTENNSIDLSINTPTMYDIFTPNNSIYNSRYNFNNFSIDSSFYRSAPLNMVDNNWSPYITRTFSQDSSGNLIKNFYQTYRLPNVANNYYTPSGKNTLYAEDSSMPFVQGVRLTGNGAIGHRWFTGTGDASYKMVYQEAPYLNGLWHNYEPIQISGYLLYTAPYFDLSSGSGYINDAIKEAFQVMVNNNYNAGPINCHSAYDGGCAQVQGSYVQSISGVTGFLQEGVDPIFLKYMGGRSGGLLVEQEGGYHPKGLIGDKWNFFNYQAYGMLGGYPFTSCGNATRWAGNDNKIVLISSTPTQTNIFTRALAFNPFTINQYPHQPFNGGETYNYSINGSTASLGMTFSGEFGLVNLATKLPLKNMTINQWYADSGMILGPFDRDMELGAAAGTFIYPTNSDLYCNGNRITDVSGIGGCDANAQFYYRNALNSGIVPGEFGRNDKFTIFAVVGKGQTITLNLSGIDSGQFGFESLTGVSGALLNNNYLTLRPRKIIGASRYDTSIHKGEETWTSPFNFLNNGLEKQYTIGTSNFENLSSNIYTVTTYSKSGKLYPIPYEDFTGLAHIDSLGNFVYPSTATVEKYWTNYAVKNNTPIYISGWREGSRLSFEFKDISIQYDAVPYQNQKIIIPSGECVISGEMGYLQQADNSVYTAGVVLKDNTEALQGELDVYTPSFSSDVLNRLPWSTGFSGKYANPILSAPSIMIQREVTGVISGEQSYIKLLNYPPYNYNKLSWTALSDLETLNAGETLETVLPTDPITFNNSNIIFSASQGQALPNGLKNPDINQTYDVVEAYQTYDSIATDALINSGLCVTSGYGTKNRLEQKSALSGVLAPIRMTLSMIKNGFI